MNTENEVAKTSTHVDQLTAKQLSVVTTKIKNELSNINSAFDNIKTRSLKVSALMAKVHAHKNELPELGYANMEEYALKEFNMQYSTMRAYVSIGESGLIDETGKCLIGDFTFDQLRAINSLHDEQAVKALIDNNMLTTDMTSKDVKEVISKAKVAKKNMGEDDNIIDAINKPVEKEVAEPTRVELIKEFLVKLGKLYDEYAEVFSSSITREEAILIVNGVETESDLAHNLRLVGNRLNNMSLVVTKQILGEDLKKELKEKFPIN